MKNAIILGIASLAFISFTSCKKMIGIKGNGTIVTEERTVVDFEEISVECEATVYLTQGSEFEVKVVTDENVMSYVETERDGNELEIKMKRNVNLRGDTEVKVYVTMPTLNGVNISGSANVYGQETWTSNNLNINISGSGDVDFGSVFLNSLDINISGSGNVDMISVDTMETENIKISGSGDVQLLQIPAFDSKIKISGSGNANVYAISTLDTDISGSGDIRYKGNPIISTDISGSGDVNPY